jgi:leader peptidase (prepilin peptidase)/N-methyltransferase
MIFFEIFFPIVFFLCGLTFGSFSNVIIYRESNGIDLLSKKRSFCPQCGHQLKWYDNIPLISFLALKGRCRYCGKPISKIYPIIEAAGAFIFVAVYFVFAYIYDGNVFSYHYLISPYAAVDSVLFSFLLLFLLDASIIDHRTLTVPLYLSVGIILIGFIRYIYTAIISKSYLMLNLISLGTAIVFFLGSYLIGKFAFKKEVMGMGDIIILLGISIGFDILSYGLFVIIITTAGSIYELIRQKAKGPRLIPFVPYILLGAVFLVFFSFPLKDLIFNLLEL